MNISVEQNAAVVEVTVLVMFEPSTTVWGTLVTFNSSLLQKMNVTVERLPTNSLLSSTTFRISSDSLTRESAYIFDAVAYDCLSYNCSVIAMQPAITQRLDLTFLLSSYENSLEPAVFGDPSASSNTLAGSSGGALETEGDY